MAIEVTVVDDSDTTGWLASAVRFGEIYMTDVKSMVSNIISLLDQKKQKMSRLNILDHGSPRGFQIGTETITTGNFPTYSVELAKLRPRFAPNGFVHLQHCQIGQNTSLMHSLATLLNVPVYAGKHYQNPIYRLNMAGSTFEGALTGWLKTIPNPFKGFEQYVRVDPNGTVTDTGRP